MITKRNVLVGLGGAVASAALPTARAQAHQHTPPQNIHVVQPKPKKPSDGYKAATEQFHKEMAIQYSANPDRDFATLMIAHHRGTIEIARMALEYTKDADVRLFAQNLIVGQEREIAYLEHWLGGRRR